MRDFTSGDVFFIELKEIERLLDKRLTRIFNYFFSEFRFQFYNWYLKKKPDNRLDLSIPDLTPLDDRDLIRLFPHRYMLCFGKVSISANWSVFLDDFDIYKTNERLYLVKK